MSVFKQLLKTLNQERIEKWLVDDYFKNILKSRLKDLARRVWDLWQMLGNKNKTSPLSNCHLTANWLKRNTMMWIECANKEHFPFSFSSLFTFFFFQLGTRYWKWDRITDYILFSLLQQKKLRRSEDFGMLNHRGKKWGHHKKSVSFKPPSFPWCSLHKIIGQLQIWFDWSQDCSRERVGSDQSVSKDFRGFDFLNQNKTWFLQFFQNASKPNFSSFSSERH